MWIVVGEIDGLVCSTSDYGIALNVYEGHKNAMLERGYSEESERIILAKIEKELCPMFSHISDECEEIWDYQEIEE